MTTGTDTDRTPRAGFLESWIVFTLALSGYIAAGTALVLGRGALPGDSLARVANAYAAVASRDPHLGAIGFVWSPVPTMVLLPFALLGRVAPVLTAHGFAATAVSAVAMATTVVLVRRTLADLGVGAVPRIAATVLFACHPMIVLYAANGMSESLAMLTLVAATGHLVRWLRNGAAGSLVGCGLWLGIGYLTRYEILAAGVAVPAVVVLVSVLREPDRRPRLRWATGALDGALVLVPTTIAFVGWAFASWALVGHPFEQFSSSYGNSTQVDAAGLTVTTTPASRWQVLVEQVLGLQPMIIVVVAAAIALFALGRSRAALAPLVCFGSVSVAQGALALSAQTFEWLRFQIMVIPLAVIAAGAVAAAVGAERRRSPRWQFAALCVIGVLLLPAAPAAVRTLRDDQLAPEEAAALRVAVDPDAASIADRRSVAQFAFDRAVADELDAMGLGRGRVLTDVALAFPIVLGSERPDQFVITSDRDFRAALQAPATFGVEYFLVQPPSGRAREDAINRAYPALHTGEGPGLLVREFVGPSGRRWRLFAVADRRSVIALAPSTPQAELSSKEASAKAGTRVASKGDGGAAADSLLIAGR